jgi:1-acyl-sn-glycerol-3-phosphate acyltransferase
VDAAYGLARTLLWPALHFGIAWTIEGADRIPATGPAIVASNHVSYLDPLALAYVADRRQRRLRFLAKRELFGKRGLGTLLRAAHQIPVDRGTAQAAASLDGAVGALAQGECIAVFPEGTISLDLEPMAGKSGTARLAAASGVPVTPVGLWGLQRVLYKGRKPHWRWGVAEVAVVGEPVVVAPDEDVPTATDRIMGAVAAAVSRARSIYPQQPAGDDDGWWVRAPETAVVRPARRSAS